MNIKFLLFFLLMYSGIQCAEVYKEIEDELQKISTSKYVFSFSEPRENVPLVISNMAQHVMLIKKDKFLDAISELPLSDVIEFLNNFHARNIENILHGIPIDEGMFGESRYNVLTKNWIAYIKLCRALKHVNNSESEKDKFDRILINSINDLDDSFEQSISYSSSAVPESTILFRWEQLAYVNEEKRTSLIEAYKTGYKNIVIPNPVKVDFWTHKAISGLTLG